MSNNQHKRELVTERKTASFSIIDASQQLTSQLERKKKDAQILERHNKRIKKEALDKELNCKFARKIMNIITIVTLFVIACRLASPYLINLFLGA